MTFAVFLMVVTVIMMLTGVLPIDGADPAIIFRTPVFAAILGLLGLSILACISKKKVKPSTIGFHLVHMGTVLIMVGGLIAFIAEKKTTFHLSNFEKPTQHIQISQTEVIDLGFSIQLKSFKVSHYAPDMLLLKDDVIENTYRISEGKTIHLNSGDDITINSITRNTKIASCELDGTPKLQIFNNDTLWKEIEVTSDTGPIQMPDSSTLLISRIYNNLPTMQNNNFAETDYPKKPGLILRLMSGDMMSIFTLPSEGKLSLLSAREPNAIPLPDIRYKFPNISNLKTDTTGEGGIASVNITMKDETFTLLQDGGILSRKTLSDGTVLQLSSPIDRQYHAEIEIDDLNGEKRTVIMGTNHPVDEQGWRFYLNSYDPNGIIITARNDPGNKIVVSGILAIMIGMPLIFFFRKRRNI